MVSNDRVFPKWTWYWTADAKRQRESDAMREKPSKDWQKDLQDALDKKRLHE